MKKGIILFSGVHGVGKGHFIKENLKDGEDDILCVSASGLIRQYRDVEDVGYKRVKDVDGHLCIINSNSEIERISETFISKAQIKGIILLQEEVPVIKQRQKLRDGICFSAGMIREIQYEEKLYAELLLKKYQIPFELVSSECSRNKFLEIINEMKGGV